MAGWNLRFLAALTLLFLCTKPGYAAAPAGSNQDRDSEAGRFPNVQEMKTIGVDRQLASFGGMVLDVNNRPLGDVHVKLFIDGELAGRAVTEGSGYYDLKAPYDPSDDITILLWYVAPDRTLMPKELVIRESKASVANGLISRCVPRASVTPGHQFRIYLFDNESRNKELAESGCLP